MSEHDSDQDGQDADMPLDEDGSPTVDDPDQVSFLEAGAPTPETVSQPDPKITQSGPETVLKSGPKSVSVPEGDNYRVLARKYRPQNFDDLLGQEAMVRMLTNAFAAGRIAHAFLLTGVRGVGKTTTARIIAKALNCIGPGTENGPTVTPCGTCENCVSITQDRNIDVIEMDAASRTGVDDIREILDGVRFRPVGARYKIYIIDEIHMLSRHAFNALLKTLEEPPESVKFIFATTDVGKLPVTVLSRCQRFDLRRVDATVLIGHLHNIAKAEGAEVDDDGLALLARAADGSVRDSLSLLDQAIAMQSDASGALSVAQLRDMLGQADGGQIYDLFEQLMGGDIASALANFKFMHDAGADPIGVIQTLMELVHWLTRIKAAGAAVDMTTATEIERVRGKELSDRLGMPILTRAWQMLLKGIGEIQTAPSAYAAAEMVLIRLAYVADLPSPGDLVRRLQQSDGASAPQSREPAGSVSEGHSGGGGERLRAVAGGGVAQSAPITAPDPKSTPQDGPSSFAEMVENFGQRREVDIRGQLFHNVHLVTFEPGRLEIRLAELAPKDLPGRVVNRLREWYGPQWSVAVSSVEGAPTLAEQARASEAADYDAAAKDPLVLAVLEAFPGARIAKVTNRQEMSGFDRDSSDYVDDAKDEDELT